MKDSRGLTLVELLALIVVLGVLAGIAVPTVLSLIGKTEADVCLNNRMVLKNDYERELVLRDLAHMDVLFEDYLINVGVVCPVGGIVRYNDGEVLCSEHSEAGDVEEDDVVVPFL
nr:prepilin-type N-terminal cleavage/methylation domain-containing protein [Metabacillus lacus]